MDAEMADVIDKALASWLEPLDYIRANYADMEFGVEKGMFKGEVVSQPEELEAFRASRNRQTELEGLRVGGTFIMSAKRR